MAVIDINKNTSTIRMNDGDKILAVVNGCYYSIEVKQGKLFGHGPFTPASGINLYGNNCDGVSGIENE